MHALRLAVFASLQHLITPSLHSYANLSGANGSDFCPARRSADPPPTHRPPSWSSCHARRDRRPRKISTFGSQPMTKRPSGVKVRKPAQPRLMLTADKRRHKTFDFFRQQFLNAFVHRRIARRQLGLIAGTEQQTLAFRTKIDIVSDVPNKRPTADRPKPAAARQTDGAGKVATATRARRPTRAMTLAQAPLALTNVLA